MVGHAIMKSLTHPCKYIKWNQNMLHLTTTIWQMAMHKKEDNFGVEEKRKDKNLNLMTRKCNKIRIVVVPRLKKLRSKTLLDILALTIFEDIKLAVEVNLRKNSLKLVL